MSVEKLEYYKKLYSEFLDHLIVLHNYHVYYVNHANMRNGEKERKHLREMIKIQKEMVKTSREVYKEWKTNQIERLAAQKSKPKRKKKDEQYNDTNASTI